MLLYLLIVLFIAIAVGLAWFLIAHDRGEREPVSALWIATGFGVVGGFAAGFIESLFISSRDLEPLHGYVHLAQATLLVGIVEELIKFVPLALFIYKRRYFNEHTDGVIYFALAGIGFGLPENILYSIGFGLKAGLGRVLLTPFFHAAITAFIGFYLVRTKLAKRSVWGVIPVLCAAIVVHGLYDFGLTCGLLLPMLASAAFALSLSAGVFLLYVRANQLDQDVGLSTVGVNNYCRSCGHPNPNHLLYCAHCGKNA